MQKLISVCYCTCCGNKMYIPRAIEYQKEKEHIKTIYCHMCKGDEQFVEIRSFDYLTPEKQKILERGILAYYYEEHGQDFLKLLLYLPIFKTGKDFEEIVSFINSGTDLLSIKGNAKLLKKIIVSIKERNEELYNKIIDVVSTRTIYINLAKCPPKLFITAKK